jgi:tetratricopeptide (TPR) repeat protein
MAGAATFAIGLLMFPIVGSGQRTATVSFREIEAERDRQAQKLFERAEKLSRKRHHVEAIGLLQQVLQSRPNYSDVRNNLALEFVALGDTSRAIEELRRIIGDDPSSILAYENLGVILCNAHRYQEAEIIARQNADVAPASLKANLILGVALAGQGKWGPEARSNLEQAGGRYPVARMVLKKWSDDYRAVDRRR